MNKKLKDSQKEQRAARTRVRASREHQGEGHWHVERRSSVIICGTCEARIPTWKKPEHCPDCGTGKRED